MKPSDSNTPPLPTFASPIPIEPTDVFLQVVFKGTLGEEPGAVAVTTKDISEPTLLAFINTNDYLVSGAANTVLPIEVAHDWHGSSIRRIDVGTYFAKEGGWIGFSRITPAVSTLKLPETGLVAGEFSRVALLLDIQQSPDSLPIVDASLAGTSIKGIQTTGAFTGSDLPVWYYSGRPSSGEARDIDCVSIEPSTSERSPCVYLARISALLTQLDPTNNQAVVPSYWAVRGITITRDQSDRPQAERAVSALVEDRETLTWGAGQVRGVRNDAFIATFPDFPSVLPKPVSLIKFSDVPSGKISTAAWEQSWLAAPYCDPVDKFSLTDLRCKFLVYYPFSSYPD